jgi:siroheme synthase-like protein
MKPLIETTFYMACLKLEGRRAVVIGGGPVGLEKVEGLLICDAKITLIAPEAVKPLQDPASERAIDWRQRNYEGPSDLEGAFMVVAATDDTELNTRVFRDAEERAMLCNVVDVPPLCNFILPAIWRQGPLAVAISTAGASPALAKRMKSQIADAFGPAYARFAEILNDYRDWAKGTLPTYQDRKVFFESIVNGDPDPIDLLRAGNEEAVHELIRTKQRESVPA